MEPIITEGAYELNQSPKWLVTDHQIINLENVVSIVFTEGEFTRHGEPEVTYHTQHNTHRILTDKPKETFAAIQQLLAGPRE